MSRVAAGGGTTTRDDEEMHVKHHLKTIITITADPMSIMQNFGHRDFRDRLRKLSMRQDQVNHVPGGLVIVLEERTTPGVIHDLTVNHHVDQAKGFSADLQAYVKVVTQYDGQSKNQATFKNGVRMEYAAVA